MAFVVEVGAHCFFRNIGHKLFNTKNCLVFFIAVPEAALCCIINDGC